MSVHKKRCRVCREWFMPDARTARFQKVCGAAACRRERKRLANAGWWAKNGDYDTARKGKNGAWGTPYPNYWQSYRALKPEELTSNLQFPCKRVWRLLL